MDSEPKSKACEVLIVSAGVGAGHNQAARAVVEGLRLADPELAVEHVDVLTFTSRAFRAYYNGGFKLSMTRLPRAYGVGFWVTNRPNTAARGVSERIRLASEWRSLAKFRQFLLDRRPPLVVHTHFLPPPAVARMVGEGALQARQMVVVTDINVHRWWYSEGVERYFLPHEFSAQQVRRWGVAEERITVSGIPIHPKWIAPLDREKVLADWRLPADKDIVILTGGTEFTCGPIVSIARGILAACPTAVVVVLAGRNKELLAELSREQDAGRRLFPQGFTDRSQELVEVCSMMITKPGGITTAECLSKGAPMILLNPVPGQEGGNADFLRREGAAVVTRRPAEVVEQAGRLLADKAELARMSAAARRLYKPGTQTIVEHVLRALRQQDKTTSD
ncbi:MAG: hypothetical protein ACE15C_15055 [Phycisphaerae bacterium]